MVNPDHDPIFPEIVLICYYPDFCKGSVPDTGRFEGKKLKIPGCVPDMGRYNDTELKILRFSPMRDYLSSYICKKIVKY